jgi:hypothetical protein
VLELDADLGIDQVASIISAAPQILSWLTVTTLAFLRGVVASSKFELIERDCNCFLGMLIGS